MRLQAEQGGGGKTWLEQVRLKVGGVLMGRRPIRVLKFTCLLLRSFHFST